MSRSINSLWVAFATVLMASSAQAENVVAITSGGNPQASHEPGMLALIMLFGWMIARRRRV